MTIESPPRDIVAIQVLRGIAATMVMFVHLDTQLARLHYSTLGSAWLAAGVDIFFVISGFIMWTSVERRRGITATTFLKNRIIRIVPLYWWVTTIVVLVGLVAPWVLRTAVLNRWYVIDSYFFLPARHPVRGVFWPVVVAGWSLNYEMLFYVVFGITIGLAGQRRALRFALIVSILVLILIVARLTMKRIGVMSFYANPILLEFVAGIVLGIIYSAGIVRASRLWFALTAIGFFLLWAGIHYNGGFSTTLIAATMIVAGAIFVPPLRNNPLSALGDASYSLYLTHALSLSAIALLWGYLFRSLGSMPFMIFSISFAIAVAFLVYKRFEMPATVALKRLSAPPRAAEIPVTPAGPVPVERQ